MNTSQLLRAAALCLGSLSLAAAAITAELNVPREGWASWEVPAVEEAPDWCCYSASGARQPCALDDQGHGYSSRDDATTDTVRVYARFTDGKIDRLHTLAATCPVESDTQIQEISGVSADESARWLISLVDGRDLDTHRHDRIANDASTALAIHRGDVAHDSLVEIARGDTRTEFRKHALFLLAHLRGLQGAGVATAMMFDDPDANIREHAAFAVSQSKSTHADTDLIRAATTDSSAKVRKHAWFSLALTKSLKTEAAIDAALRKETNSDVREHAIFALSQLPSDRATRALIKVAENKALGREERKRAMFWLSQSDSSAAQAYLERILARAPQ